MRFKNPNPKDYEDTPHVTMKRPDGSILRAYKHKTIKGCNRVTIDHKPYDPMSMVDKATDKKLEK